MLQEPSWPTPSGIQENEARVYCIDYIMQSDLANSCNKVIEDDLSRIVDACATDIKVNLSHGTEYLKKIGMLKHQIIIYIFFGGGGKKHTFNFAGLLNHKS